MFLFGSKKTPEEKEAARLEKLRREEANLGFGGAIMTPVAALNLADVCLIRLYPDAKELRVSCMKRAFAIPYQNLRGLAVASENEIAKDCGAISLEEMHTHLTNGCDQFLGYPNATTRHPLWYARLDFVDEENQMQHLTFIVYSAKGPYRSASPLYAITQFSELLADVMGRYPLALSDGSTDSE